MDQSTSNGRASEPFQPSADAHEDVGIAYTTNEQVGTSAAAFDHQYQQQQQAYQQAVREQDEMEKAEQQAIQTRIIKTLETTTPSSTSTFANQSSVSVAPSNSQTPAQNRVFGLAKDLAGPSTDTAHLNVSSRIKPRRKSSIESLSSLADSSSPSSPSRFNSIQNIASASTSNVVNTDNQPSKGSDGPQFSVEVVAPAFDKRGYPVFSGRGARIRGFLRTRPVKGCEIYIKLSAGTTQGALATMWDGVALMPQESGNEKRVFLVEEHILLKESMAQLRPGSHPSSTDRDDYIYTTPFEVHLPLGVSTRYVNGEPTTTAVALPPSYEMSSENDAKEREATKANNLLRSSAASIKSKSSRMTNFGTSVGGIGSTVKEAVEKGLGEVYRVGCFYKIAFTLRTIPTGPTESPKKSWGKKKKTAPKTQVLDEITIPFIFTGEPTLLPPPPHSIPLPLVAPVLLNPGVNLGDQWDCERSQSKWSGNIFRASKRTVDLEMHMPSPAVLQAPSVFPIILIIRPNDPTLLSSIPGSDLGVTSADTETIHGSNVGSYSPMPSTVSKATTPQMEVSPNDKETLNSTDSINATASDRERDGMLSKFMKSSLALGRKPSNISMNPSSSMSTLSPLGNPPSSSGNSIRGSLASTFSRKRPNTAPSGGSSSSSPGTTLMIGSSGQYTGDVSGLVRVSLLQTTYCSATGPSDVPKSRRKLISQAEMEEVDISDILGEMSKESKSGDRGDEATLEANQALIEHVRSKGIRVVQGVIRVGTDTTPSFRCQGIEVKYALKVDLIPFSKKEGRRPNSGGSSTGGGWAGDNASMRSRPSINIPPSPTLNSNCSPPMPPFPAEHRQNQHSISSTVTPGNAHQQNYPQYSPSVAFGLGEVGGGGTSTIVSESAMANLRLEKGIGALWADVRMVRSALTS